VETDQRIQSYINGGEFWRAKEVLQGRIANAGFEPELYELLGFVLLEMQDTMNAGKYLFLSGVRKSEYSDAIALFIGRYAKKDIRQLFWTFPKSVQYAPLTAYPAVVHEELEKLGLSQEPLKELRARRLPTEVRDRSGIGFWFISSLVILLLLGIAISSVQGLLWLFKVIWF